MNLIQMNAQATQAESLDSLWCEAERLGKIEVHRPWGGKEYKVTIAFDRKSGTTIYARGSDTSIHFAIANAINEAREMGA